MAHETKSPYTQGAKDNGAGCAKKTWRKTIVLISVKKSVKGKEKSGAVRYDVITQVVVLFS